MIVFCNLRNLLFGNEKSIKFMCDNIYKLVNCKYLINNFLFEIKSMGNNCCAENQKLGGGFSDTNLTGWDNIQMVPFSDQTIQRNLTDHKNAAPAATYGRRVNQRPKLFYLVEDSRQREFGSRALAKPANTGVSLPPYFLNRYKAYYEGDWQNGQPNGLGKLYFQNGSYFEGPFANGQIAGQDGIYFYPDGSFKRGNIINGKLQGPGRFVSRSGNFIYDGLWKNDQPNGRGVQIYPDGSKYEGNFVDGIKNDDNAVFRWANGKVYQGPFRNGYMEGHGRLYMEGGKGQYVGQFSRNLKVGHGRMKTQTGEYEGPFQFGQMHGNGTFKWYDGKVYEGQFDRGDLHGNGTIFYPNGQMVKGVWHRGENLHMDNISVGKSQIRV